MGTLIVVLAVAVAVLYIVRYMASVSRDRSPAHCSGCSMNCSCNNGRINEGIEDEYSDS